MEKRFNKRYTKHTIKDSAHGVSYSELWKECDFDHDKTAKLIEHATARNDMYEKAGLYHWKRSEIAKTEVHKAGKVGEHKTAIKDKKAWDALEKETRMSDWVQFAFLNKRKLAIEDNRVEETTKPASAEAQAMLQSAYDTVNDVLNSVRDHCQKLTQAMAGKPAIKTHTLRHLISTSMENVGKFGARTNTMSSLLIADVVASTDADMKKIMHQIAPDYEALLGNEGELNALVKMHCKKEKKPPAA